MTDYAIRVEDLSFAEDFGCDDELVEYFINFLDQYQYLGNCPPTPPLTQQQSIDNMLGLMLG